MIPLTHVEQKGSPGKGSPTLNRLFPPSETNRRHSVLSIPDDDLYNATGNDVMEMPAAGSGLLSSLTAATSAAAFMALAVTDNDNIEVARNSQLIETSYRRGACLKRRHVYVAMWPSGRTAEINPFF